MWSMLPNTIDIESERADRGQTFRVRCENFAGHFVGMRNPAAAYRVAFVPDKSMALSVMNTEAQRLLREPKMRKRIQDLIDAAAASTAMSIRAIVVDVHDVATADPNELVSHVIDCCRWCHGIEYGFQWKTEREYAAACDQAMRQASSKPDAPSVEMPSCVGGFGFDPRREPHPCCPECFGRGDSHVILHDTTRLSPAARKLFKGAKQTKNGIEIELHDQQAARDTLLRIAGAYKDALPLDIPQLGAEGRDAIPAQATEVEAGRAYLQLVSGG